MAAVESIGRRIRPLLPRLFFLSAGSRGHLFARLCGAHGSRRARLGAAFASPHGRFAVIVLFSRDHREQRLKRVSSPISDGAPLSLRSLILQQQAVLGGDPLPTLCVRNHGAHDISSTVCDQPVEEHQPSVMERLLASAPRLSERRVPALVKRIGSVLLHHSRVFLCLKQRFQYLGPLWAPPRFLHRVVRPSVWLSFVHGRSLLLS